MYSPRLIAVRQRRLERRSADALPPDGLQRHPVSHCHAMRTHLQTCWDPEARVQTRPLTEEEQGFVANEILLSTIDYAYWAERYAIINFLGQALRPMYPLWESQRLILAEFARVEEARWQTRHPDGLLFNCLKGRQLGCCLDPATRVLTADLRWISLDALGVGEEVITVDEVSPGGCGAARKMRTGVVEGKRDICEEAYQIVCDDGRTLYATATHRFLYSTRTGDTCTWRMVQDMRVGGRLRAITTPWGAPGVEDGWMGGMLDGEGSCNKKKAGGAEVSVSQLYGAVYDRVVAYFVARGYTYHEDIEKSVIRAGKFGRKPIGKASLGRMDEIFRLIGQTRPVRFRHLRWWEGKELPGKRNGTGRPRILSITAVGRRRMVDLQTSTKTFIAEGFVSHNSTLVQSLLAHRATTQGHVRGLIASDVPQNSGSEGLFGMLELLVARLPWWLVPLETFHTKNHHIMWKNGSRVVVESGRSMKGGLQDEGGEKGQIGRSRTYSAVHLSEIATWERPEQINSSLLPAIPRTPRTLCVRESTAAGRHNYWHTEWTLAAEGKDARFQNIFIPWYAEATRYWLPYPTDWTPTADTLAFAARAAQHGPTYLHRSVVLSKEQLYWYEIERGAAVARDELYKFLSEYPSEPEEAFQSSGRSIFSVATMDRLEKQARPLLDVWSIRPHADLAADRDASLAESRQAQHDLKAEQEKARQRAAAGVVGEATPQTVLVEPFEEPVAS
jgi:hypothetical protein